MTCLPNGIERRLRSRTVCNRSGTKRAATSSRIFTLTFRMCEGRPAFYATLMKSRFASRSIITSVFADEMLTDARWGALEVVAGTEARTLGAHGLHHARLRAQPSRCFGPCAGDAQHARSARSIGKVTSTIFLCCWK